jgi:transcriptional regulator with XRE-family HTH domain
MIHSALDEPDAALKKEGMTPRTARAARVLLGLSQAEVADLAGVTMLTVSNYELEKGEPAHKTWRSIKGALERAGARFIDEDDYDGPGVRLRKAVRK